MELDKNLIKNNFKKSFLTYEENAIVQKECASKLISLLGHKSFDDVLEVGSYSGYLTRLAIENINCRRYSAMDILEESEFAVKKVNPSIKFINCDVENFSSNEKYDLILSNASLQWCDSIKNVIKKLKSNLKTDGLLAVSIFQKDNLFEIKDAFGVGLKYPSMNEIRRIFSVGAKIIELNKTLEFNNPLEILKHLKYTGVNSVRKNDFSFLKIKSALKILEEKYNNKITYKAVIIID